MEASDNEEAAVVVTIEGECKSDHCSDDGSSCEDSGEEEIPCSPPVTDSNNVSVLSKSTTSGTPKKNQGNMKKTWQNRNGGNNKNYNKGSARNFYNQGNSKPSDNYGKSGYNNQSKNEMNSSKISYSSSRNKNKSDHSYSPDRNKFGQNCSPDKNQGNHNYSPDRYKGCHSNNNLDHVSCNSSSNSSENSGNKKNGNGSNGNKNKNSNNNENNGNKNQNNNNNQASNKSNNSEKSDKTKVAILQQLQCFAPWLRRRRENHSPFNTTVMQLHTRWTIWFFFQIAMIVWQNWYWKDGLITCINQMDAKKAVDHYLNICLSYIFTHMTDKKYLMHYRWIHWMFALLAAAYFVLKILTMVLDNPRVKQFLEDVARLSQRYDKNSVEQTKKEVVAYFQLHAGRHQGLYINLLLVHCLAHLLDLIVIAFIDFALQGQFMLLVPEAFPFQRDYVGFTDHLSTVFPPFAFCTFNKDWGMHVSRTEHYACHLTLMELYEKIYIFVWLWMGLLVVWSGLYLIFLCVALLLPVWPFIQHVTTHKRIQGGVSRTWGPADFYILFCVKRRISAAAFIKVTEELGIAASSGCRDVEQGMQEHSYYRNCKPCVSDIIETETGHLDHIGFCEQVLSGGNDDGNKLYRRQKKCGDLSNDLKDCEP